MQHGRHGGLVIDAAQAIDAPAINLTPKGLVGPAGVLAERHGVNVGVDHNGRSIIIPHLTDYAPRPLVRRHHRCFEAGLR